MPSSSSTPRQVAQCIEETGIGFMFAPSFHPAMKFAGPLRREVGFRTVFNILGPLTNPAGATCHVMGAANLDLAERLAHVLSRLDMRHALVVFGDDGLDDISVTRPNDALRRARHRGHAPDHHAVRPRASRSTRSRRSTGGTPEQNAALVRSVLTQGSPLSLRDLVVAQAGAGLYVCGLASSLRNGVEMALSVIESGDAAREARRIRRGDASRGRREQVATMSDTHHRHRARPHRGRPP